MYRASLVILFSLFFSFKVTAQDFVVGFEDIPIADGLYQSQNNDIIFGNEETRYIETSLTAKTKATTFSSVAKFYKDSLKQLGWRESNSQQNHLLFYREQDILEIVKIKDSPLKISIILKNKN